MPLYEYECDACGQRFELIQKFSDPSPETCEKCGSGPVHRLLSSPAIQFKGSGWYITDYAQKGKSDSGASTGKTAESGTSDTGSATKSESKTETPGSSSDSSTAVTSSASASTTSTAAKKD